MNDQWKMVSADVEIIRGLALQYAEIARRPAMEERRQLWRAHNDMETCRPLVLMESQTAGLKDEIFAGQGLRCQEPWARQIEDRLRSWIYHFDVIQDDDVAMPCFPFPWFADLGNYGVEVRRQHGTDAEGGTLGFHWDPPIKDLARDFDKLKERQFFVDREKTLVWKEHLERVFGGFLPVMIRGQLWWTMGMTWGVIDLVGLEKMMLLMYDEPVALHRLMAFMRDDHLRLIDFCEKEGLFSLNNEGDYIGSGSRGFTRTLPRKEWEKGRPVLAKDLWMLLESQETVGVSPDMFAEFILPYQRAVAARFGRVYYGCCEPLHNRWKHVKTIPNLHSVSVSPWADERRMAEDLARNYVYSRKPNPSLLSTERFDEGAVRADIRRTLVLAKGCNVEIIMKDLHTTHHHPERMARWVRICREEIHKAGWNGK